MLQNGVPLPVAVFFAVIEGDGHDSAGLQQTQTCVNGCHGGSCLGKDGRIPAGETAKVEYYAVHSAGGGILLHVGVTVQNDLGGEPLRR